VGEYDRIGTQVIREIKNILDIGIGEVRCPESFIIEFLLVVSWILGFSTSLAFKYLNQSFSICLNKEECGRTNKYFQQSLWDDILGSLLHPLYYFSKVHFPKQCLHSTTEALLESRSCTSPSLRLSLSTVTSLVLKNLSP
jgi:hypothetical protein